MRLNVPLFLQAENSLECGPICLKMLLSYYGEEITYEEIISQFKYFGNGIPLPRLGIYLINKGFEVEIITLNPFTFPYSMLGESNKMVIKNHLIKRQSLLKEENDQKIAQALIDFIDVGGNFRLKIPNKEDIVNEIQNGRPLIAILTSNYLHNNILFNFHFNLITGIEDNFVYVNDPMWGLQGGKNKLPLDGFLQAVYATSYGDLDNSAFLVARKKSGDNI